MMKHLGYFILSLTLATLPLAAISSPLLAGVDAAVLSGIGAAPQPGADSAHSPHGALNSGASDRAAADQSYPACCVAMACMAFLTSAGPSVPGVAKRIAERADPVADGRNGTVAAPNPPPPRI